MSKESGKNKMFELEVGKLPLCIANTQLFRAVPYDYRDKLYKRCAELEGVTAVGNTQYLNCFSKPVTNINKAFLDGERANPVLWKIRVTAMMMALIDIHNEVLVDLQKELEEHTENFQNAEVCIEYAEAELKYQRNVLNLSKRQISEREERKATIENVLQNNYLNSLITESNEQNDKQAE